MQTPIKLTNPTDDQLSAAVAEHVAGWEQWTGIGGAKLGGWNDHNKDRGKPEFATSADAVLPLLEKYASYTAVTSDSSCSAERYAVILSDNGCMSFGPTFPRAACIALLRANGIEVEVP